MVVVFTLGLDICVNEFLILRDNFKFSSKFKVVTQYSYLKRYDVTTQQNAQFNKTRKEAVNSILFQNPLQIFSGGFLAKVSFAMNNLTIIFLRLGAHVCHE